MQKVNHESFAVSLGYYKFSHGDFEGTYIFDIHI